MEANGKSDLPPQGHRETMLEEARRKARFFLDHQQQYRLGVLPIEQANPKTSRLAETAQADLEAAVRMLQAVDWDIVPVADRGFAGREFGALLVAMRRTIDGGGRICFSGCGATGRLSILLEASWRRFWQELRVGHPAIAARLPDLEDRIVSIMTGGDYALVRSVENFEDYGVFGRRQVQEAHLGQGDILVALTGTAETSSVIGTLWQAVDDGAGTFLVFNTPADVAARHIERARQVIDDPRIGKLCLDNGPMAVTGSTRMQSTSTQLLVVGAALEMALDEWLGARLDAAELKRLCIVPKSTEHYRRQFAELMDDLGRPQAVTAMAAWIRYEEQVYRRKGLVTYLADECLLDIFTDTTERSPTFMLPRFRACDDPVSPPSWAFVKNPRRPTPEAWRQVLRRPPRCLTWDSRTYLELGAPVSLQKDPPRLGAGELFKFLVGNEHDPSRCGAKHDAAMLIVLGEEAGRLHAADDPLRQAFCAVAAPFPNRAVLAMGPTASPADLAPTVWHLPVRLPQSALRLGDRLAAKLALNTVSTLTAARLGRLVGNSMAHLHPSNKKLVDRGTRLIAEQAGVDYETACFALHETMEELAHLVKPGEETPSPVAATIAKLTRKPQPQGETQ
ncbi:MAG: sugar phosphate isomerase [Planctomycetaceae bacterium]|nr:sugar phosphate isomerase [Planctomycetaceae bacterium]